MLPAGHDSPVADRSATQLPRDVVEPGTEDRKQSSLLAEASGHSDGLQGFANEAAWKRHRLFTTVLVNLSMIMERLDEQLLPAVYAFVAASFGASPRELGYLTQCRALVQALASPLGGLAGYYFNRIWLITVGCGVWGCATALFSACSGLAPGYLLWAINGLGLSLVIPAGQSVTADYFSEAARGRAFGALYMTGAFGAMLGTVYATNLGGKAVLGVEGWRFAFFSVAMASLAIGALNLLLGRDPRCEQRWTLRQKEAAGAGTLSLSKELREMCLLPTFLIIILQGIVGSTPWNALVFLTLYLQTIGMTDGAASALVAIFLGGSAFGGLLGGWLGDLAAKASPRAGRIAVCQFSVFVGVPLSAILFKGFPLNGQPATAVLYGALLGCMGLVISWAAPACNNPIFAEIVPPHLRTVIYAFDRSFESAVAASAAPLVGLLAETAFGWQGTATPHGGSAEKDLENARALGNAMLVCTCVPWGLCGLFYTGLYFTYPADRAKADSAARDLLPTGAVGIKAGKGASAIGVHGGERQALLSSAAAAKASPSLELAALHAAEREGRDGERAGLLPDSERSADVEF